MGIHLAAIFEGFDFGKMFVGVDRAWESSSFPRPPLAPRSIFYHRVL